MKISSTLHRNLEKLGRLVASFLPVLLLLTVLTGNAGAALQAVGPNDPATGFPVWYQDGTGLAIQECLDEPAVGAIPFCTLLASPGFIPTQPIVALPTMANYPIEMFYWVADAKFNTVPGVPGAIAAFRLGLEATFATGVVLPGQQITFLLVNLQKMSGLPPNSSYTVTHPFGTFTFTTDAAGNTVKGLGGQAFRVRDDTISIPFVYNTLLPAPFTKIGPFLRPSLTTGGAALPPILDPLTGNTYLANPTIATPVTGGTNGNIITITGPGIGGPGVNTVSNNVWFLQGKVFTGQIPSPMTIDRASYARNAATGQIDVFATAAPTAILSVSGTGLTTGTLAQDAAAPGKFFGSLPFGATLPTAVTLNNSLDVPPVPNPITMKDEVQITEAIYNTVSKGLFIKAHSRDTATPQPTLTVAGFAAPNTLDATGAITLPLPLNTNPPLNVQVLSSNGGSDIAPVSVVTPPPAPVAVNDTASTIFNTPVAIDVLLNDTTAAQLDAATVGIVATSLNGTTLVQPNGAVLFTPTAGFNGTTTFTYDVEDIYGQLSNTATVTVTVAPPLAPVTVADTAATTQNIAVTIPVLANDTGFINAASVVISTQSLSGTAVANATGTVTFTPALGFTGTATFAYTVNDTGVPPLTSLPATVTVTVNAPAAALAPVAVADSATTAAGTPVTIPVLANDTIIAPGAINTGSVVISTQSLSGTAVANATGTITFSPAAGFVGTTTFAYTVANSSVPALTSAPALVTVTVTAPAPAPVANNDSATTTAGTAVTTSVLANDTIGAPGVINAASVQIATPSANGTAVANANGTVSFTPAAGFTGITSYSYTVANNSTPPLRSNAATVTVTVNAAAAQSIAVSRAQFTLSSAAWRIDGTVTPAPPAGTTLTVYNSALVGGGPALIGNLSVAGNGSFTWSSPNGAPQPNAARRISIQSNQNPATKLENITVTVR